MESAYTRLPVSLEQASNMAKFGLIHAENGFWKRARALQLQVVTHRKSRLGATHAVTIFAQRALATTHWNLFEMRLCLEVHAQMRQALW